MATMTVMPRESRDWTVDDLDALPDDGLQYELLDGILLVTPAPVPLHQRVARGLFRLLDDRCPDDLEVFFAPLDWRPDRRTSLQPDVLVVRRADVGVKNIQLPLLLAVEVLSPSTRRKDIVLKRSKYEDAGIASYWVVDPEEPSIVAWDLRDGRYVEIGRAVGDERLPLDQPYPVVVVPAALHR
jgi:Uma2 family endonuclease